MKYFTLLILALHGLSPLFSQSTFQAIYGFEDQGDYGESIIQLPDGNFMMCGVRTYEGGQGVLKKIDGNGNLIWSKNYSDINSSHPDLNFYDIILTSDENIAVGGLSNYGYQNEYYQAYLAKFDFDGNMLWEQIYGGAYAQSAKKIIETADGGYLLAGANNNTNAANSLTIYAVKTDEMGNMEWQYIHPDDPNDPIRYRAYTVLQNEVGDYILAGTINQILNWSTDMFVLKLNEVGDLLWESILDYDIGAQARGVFVKQNGNIQVCGWEAPNWCANPIVAELNSDGEFLFDHSFHFGNLCEWSQAFTTDESGNLVMFSFNSESQYRIVKFDSEYNVIWNQTYTIDQATSAMGNGISYCSDDGGFVATGTSIVDSDIQAIVIRVDGEGNIVTGTLNNELENIHFEFYPNPANNLVGLKYTAEITIQAITMIDLQGRTLKSFSRPGNNLDVSGFPSGCYLMRIETIEGEIVKKVVLE